ncbi:uncharacterized protein CLAFUR5_07757 [Fulvia fulva]|uniref:Monopolin complex subunit Csm1/Pcs1 C-terminal domain-containing protein n=1 Tax=Passalora fulva TaxID=5499 RepID=A0A9Q8LC95_PASFU|nr:uncharacterized protein CLAFUR5_07757 [Fulvia fulva]KAK4629805.1 hypothetical protein CLAFUR0_07634 [Fulvia fulva]UJO14856.1 hypothetical protein CLAFUR5_07757 [Fulvia fulva]
MPPRAKAAPARAGGDESEDDLAATTTHATTATENKRAAATKTTKEKATARRVSVGKPAAKRKAAPKRTRKALEDRTNIPDGNETEEVEAFDDEEMADPAKPKAKRAKTTTTRKNVAKENVEESTKKKRGRPAKRAPSPEPLMTIPETQPDPDQMEDVEQSIEMEPNMDIPKEPTPPPLQKFVQRAPSASIQPLLPRPSARAGSAQPGYARPRERSGSASGTERRGGDPELRRQLNEMTKKHENLQLKYEGLEELGKKQLESNFERLKRASDQKARDAHELITSLKKELAELRKSTSSTTSETTTLQKQVDSLTTSNEKLATERDDLTGKLQVSQNEVKSLEAKLSNARQQISSGVEEAKAAAAKKPNGVIAISTTDAQKEAKMKEDLYSDLTGLIIMGVKRNEGEDVYKCVQTGRNGTLQFHLSVGNDATTPNPKTPSGLRYEDAEFAYEPLFDEKNDKALLDILPDYLTEEICFPRNHAQRFYSKVVDSMTKRIVVEDD